MRKFSGRVPARLLAGSGAAACLVLSGAVPGTAAAAARAPAVATAADTLARPAADIIVPDGFLTSVAAVSARDAWAVGGSIDYSTGLITRWNGARWSVYATPPNTLTGVAARSATDVWAVGGTLAMHWNGRSWTRVATPALKGGLGLSAVAVTSSDNAWAVGQAGQAPGSTSPASPLVVHWNGRRWAVQPSQSPPGGGKFNAVSAVSGGIAWAVGSAGSQTLAEHWNGTRWSRWASPNVPGATASSFNSVVMISANNAWAVGTATMPSATVPGGTTTPLTAFWNGQRWRLVPSPNPAGDASLAGVTASWTNNIWAVGTYNPLDSCTGDGCDPLVTLIMHWNGTRWKVLPSPSPEDNFGADLFGIAAAARDDIWAVGQDGTQHGLYALIVHWNGSAWS
jgi:hypothetical protein